VFLVTIQLGTLVPEFSMGVTLPESVVYVSP
jgi:hypothetical protein